MLPSDLAATFRRRFRARERLVGTFVKTPAPHIVEIVASAGYDFVVIDAEHAPFDRDGIDRALLAAAAAGIPALVRTADRAPAHLLAALDDGAAGIVASHIDDAAAAAALVSTCRYAGTRGFSASTRAGGYGARTMWQHVDASDAATTVIAMIEDPAAVGAIHDILSTDGLDGIFIGRADLTVAIGDRRPGAPEAEALAATAIGAARSAGVPVCLFVGSVEEAEPFADDVTAFVVSSDQGMLREMALRHRTGFAALPPR